MFGRRDGDIKRIKIKLVILAVFVIIAIVMRYTRG